MSPLRFLARVPLVAALALCLLAPGALAAKPSDAAAAPAAPAPAKKLDLNTATETQLVELPKVGPATAKAILDYRKQVGTIRTVDELVNVKGIGEKTLEVLRPFVMVTSSAEKGASGGRS